MNGDGLMDYIVAGAGPRREIFWLAYKGGNPADSLNYRLKTFYKDTLAADSLYSFMTVNITNDLDGDSNLEIIVSSWNGKMNAFHQDGTPVTGFPFDAGAYQCLVDGALLLDLNGFKDINDTLGHHAGDRVLQWVARRVRGPLRQADTVARLEQLPQHPRLLTSTSAHCPFVAQSVVSVSSLNSRHSTTMSSTAMP